MEDLICQIANVGLTTDWIKAGLNQYNYNYLLIITTNEQKYIQIAENFKSEIEKSAKIDTDRKLDSKSQVNIEILKIKNRDIINFISIIKQKLRKIRKEKYKIYYNATSGLQIWKFAFYFIYAEEELIDKFFYYPVDSPKDEPISPIEFYKPLKISASLRNILGIFGDETYSLDDIISNYQKKDNEKPSKGFVSRYLNELKNLGLIEESKKKIGRKKSFKLTKKGKWFI